MKKRLTIISTTILTTVIIIIGAATLKLTTFANSDTDINSSGSISLEGGDVLFDAEDIENMQTQVNTLSNALSDEAHLSSGEGTLKNVLNSKGIINYDSGKVIFDSSDLVKLANGIDSLQTAYPYEVVESLSSIHTYYKADGSITHNKEEAVSSQEASKLTFGQICNGILKSQSLEHLAEDDILPASADNLSAGSAAWVNGDIVIGTGNDNKANYEEGYEKGFEAGEAANVGGQCYYVGHVTTIDAGSGLFCCDVKTRAPEIDYTKLTADNFIICPYYVNAYTEKSTKTASISGSVTPFCTIPQQDLILRNYTYNPETGLLTFPALKLSASGGLSSKSGYTKTTETSVTSRVYIYTGNIIKTF